MHTHETQDDAHALRVLRCRCAALRCVALRDNEQHNLMNPLSLSMPLLPSFTT